MKESIINFLSSSWESVTLAWQQGDAVGLVTQTGGIAVLLVAVFYICILAVIFVVSIFNSSN